MGRKEDWELVGGAADFSPPTHPPTKSKFQQQQQPPKKNEVFAKILSI
jgi:hypothetical protein